MSAETAVIEARYCGPDKSGNGGWSAGTVGRIVADPGATVRLQAPPPLDTPLAVERDGGVARLRDGATVIAEARPDELEMFAPPLVSWAEAVDAAHAFAGHEDHPFPRCFTCGTARDPDEALCLHPGPVADGVVAAPWTPAPSLAAADGTGRVDVRAVWAALDCPGAWAHDFKATPGVLGSITATVSGEVHVGERYVVTGHNDGREGRKMFASGTVVEAETGAVVARSRTIWIELTPEAAETFA